MSVSFDSYKIFYYAAKYGNITAAARALYLSQPTVSQCIINIERELDCRLFMRTKKGVIMTPEGEILYKHISVACRHIWEAEEAISSAIHLSDGTIRIGATETTLHHYLLPYLRTFKETYPDIKLKISNNNTHATLKALETGLIDFAIIVSTAKRLASYQVYPLSQFQDILIGGEKYAALSREALPLSSLPAYPLVCMESGTVTRQFVDDFFISHGVTLTPDIELETMDLIVPMVENNLGIGFVPYDFAREKMAEKKVYRLPLADELPPRSICLVTSNNHPLSSASLLFTNMLCK